MFNFKLSNSAAITHLKEARVFLLLFFSTLVKKRFGFPENEKLLLASFERQFSPHSQRKEELKPSDPKALLIIMIGRLLESKCLAVFRSSTELETFRAGKGSQMSS